MFLMKKVTNKSLRDIGEFLGGRDLSLRDARDQQSGGVCAGPG